MHEEPGLYFTLVYSQLLKVQHVEFHLQDPSAEGKGCLGEEMSHTREKMASGFRYWEFGFFFEL